MTARTLLLILAALATATAGCRPEDQRTETIDVEAAEGAKRSLAPGASAQLDSGNAAYRSDDFEEARRHYRAAAEAAPDAAATWFGVFLAERALGNEEAAREALAKARSLAPGATLLHGAEEESR